jgi:hypothetical protein
MHLSTLTHILTRNELFDPNLYPPDQSHFWRVLPCRREDGLAIRRCGTWGKVNGHLGLKMSGSGTSGSLRLQSEFGLELRRHSGRPQLQAMGQRHHEPQERSLD